MKKWPKISIVTPSYNQGIFLEQTILSVLEQNYPNLEYIIIDGGSTDGSVDIIRKYSDKLSYWVSEKDEGQADALNKGFRRATGEIVAFLNSDDLFCPGALISVAEAFTANPEVNFVFGNSFDIDREGKILRDNRHTRFSFTALVLLGSTITQCASFWKRELFEKCGYFDCEYFFSFDYEFFCRLGPHLKAKRIGVYLSKFRWHPSSKSSTITDVREKDDVQIRNAYRERVCRGRPEKLVVLAVYISRVYWYFVQGDGIYVLRGVLRRCLPRRLTPRWL